MANGHGFGNHPFVVIIGVIAALITVWSFVTDKPPYISAFRSFLEEVTKSLPSENLRTEANPAAHQQAEQTHSEEAQRKAQEQTRRFEQQAAEAQRKDQEQTRALTRRREQQEAEAQRKDQERTRARRKQQEAEEDAQRIDQQRIRALDRWRDRMEAQLRRDLTPQELEAERQRRAQELTRAQRWYYPGASSVYYPPATPRPPQPAGSGSAEKRPGTNTGTRPLGKTWKDPLPGQTNNRCGFSGVCPPPGSGSAETTRTHRRQNKGTDPRVTETLARREYTTMIVSQALYDCRP